MKHYAYSAVALTILAACDSGTNVPQFQSDGLQEVLTQEQASSSRESEVAGVSYVFQVGAIDEGNGLLAEADLSGVSNLPDPPLDGTATMHGTLELRAYFDPTALIGVSRNRDDFELKVDFVDQTFAADTDPGAEANLSLRGDFANDGTISGTAQYLGMTGAMAGDISGDDAIGVFNGEGAISAFAGGFVVEK